MGTIGIILMILYLVGAGSAAAFLIDIA